MPFKLDMHFTVTQYDVSMMMVQVLLTGEPVLVASAASLLHKALQHNTEALPRLYQTGLYFFALGYCGSNLVEVATLFQVCIM